MKIIRTLATTVLVVCCMLIAAAEASAQVVGNDRHTYIRTGRTTTLDVFAGIPKYNGNPAMQNGYGIATAQELGIVGDSYWNEFNLIAIEIKLQANTRVRYIPGTKRARYLVGECRWWDGKKWIPWENRLVESGEPTQPTVQPPQTTTLTVTKVVNNPNPGVGDQVQYTVTVKNTGTVAAKSVKITDTIKTVPSVTVAQIMSVSRSYSGSVSEMTLNEELPSNGEVVIIYTATIGVSGLVVPNVVTVCAANASCVTATVTVSTPPPQAQTITLECPKDGIFQTWATTGERIFGGKIELVLSVVTGAAVSAAASSNGNRGRAAIEGAAYSAIANRAGNALFPDHNRARLKVAGGESPELKKGGSGPFTVAGLNYVYDWSERRITVQIPDRGCLWSASPRQTFVFTPVPVIRRGHTNQQSAVKIDQRPGKGGSKAPN